MCLFFYESIAILFPGISKILDCNLFPNLGLNFRSEIPSIVKCLQLQFYVDSRNFDISLVCTRCGITNCKMLQRRERECTATEGAHPHRCAASRCTQRRCYISQERWIFLHAPCPSLNNLLKSDLGLIDACLKATGILLFSAFSLFFY